MSLQSPNLDDRDWRMLMQAARERIRETCPDWTDLSASDPGTALIDVFAHLTEILIYRVNRIPEKVYVEFLNLLGLQLEPATTASTTLHFGYSEDAEQKPVTIPARQAVLSADGSQTFYTQGEVRLTPEEPSALVLAAHGEFVTITRTCTGKAGHHLEVPAPGMARGPSQVFDLEVLVETSQTDEADISIDGRSFRRWQEVESFAESEPGDHVFTADRRAGRIQFAPAADLRRDGDQAALARIPEAGAQVRVTYLKGGGPEGNLRAGELTTLAPEIDGVTVTQPERAFGGSPPETLEQAVRRGSLELRRPFRAVTARDYEMVAESLAQVDRAKSLTQRDLWDHALPGTVEVAVIAADGEDFPPEALAAVDQELNARRPLGTRCVTRQAGMKAVAIEARLTVHAAADPVAVEQRIKRRIDRLLDPRRKASGGGEWPFGQSLHVSRIYEACLAEPGIVSVETPRIRVIDSPSRNLTAIAADTQRDVWYAADGVRVFRSVNRGAGWELALDLGKDGAAQTITAIAVSPFDPGHLAVLVDLAENKGASLWISTDCGQSWPMRSAVGHGVADVAWTRHDEVPALLLATDKGLFRTTLSGSRSVDAVLGAPQNRLFAVSVSATESARFAVALGTRKQGVFLSLSNAAENSFKNIGGDSFDVRELEFQEIDGHTFLWGGVVVPGRDSENGVGALRWPVGAGVATSDQPEPISAGWLGQPFGSCIGLAFGGQGNRIVIAGTSSGHVLELDVKADPRRWKPTPEEAGIGYGQEGEYAGSKPLLVGVALQTGPAEDAADPLMVAGKDGMYRVELSRDRANTTRFERIAEFREVVTLPATWVFKTGAHDLEVQTQGGA